MLLALWVDLQSVKGLCLAFLFLRLYLTVLLTSLSVDLQHVTRYPRELFLREKYE